MKKILFFIIICLSSLNCNCSEASGSEANDADQRSVAAGLRAQLHDLRSANERHIAEARAERDDRNKSEADYREQIDELETEQRDSKDSNFRSAAKIGHKHRQATDKLNLEIQGFRSAEAKARASHEEAEASSQRTITQLQKNIKRKTDDIQPLQKMVREKCEEIATLNQDISGVESQKGVLQTENGAQKLQLVAQDKQLAAQHEKIVGLIGERNTDLVGDNKKLLGDNEKLEKFIIGSGVDFVIMPCLENRLPSAHKQIFNNRDFAAVLSTVTGTVVKEVRYRYKSGEKTDGKELLIGGAVDVGCKFVGMKAVTAALFATNYASNFWNEKDCIDVEKHRGTIETVQTVAGNALIFCAGPSLTDFFKH